MEMERSGEGNIAAGPGDSAQSCNSELQRRVCINTSLRGTSDIRLVTCDYNLITAIHEPT